MSSRRRNPPVKSPDYVRVRIVFSYDGSGFHGWQRQANKERTVQAEMEAAFSQVCNDRIIIVATGRTDAGVHARIQVAHADIPRTRLEMIRNKRLAFAINTRLHRGVRIYAIDEMEPDFDCQYGIEKKTYLYFIDTSEVQHPSLRHYAWHLRLPLDWDLIQKETRELVGTHDFKAFCDSDANTKTSVRTLYEAYWERLPGVGLFGPSDLMVLRLTGSGFLKHMVRSITGTLIKAGNPDNPTPGIVVRALTTQDRRLAGATAPPHGLWLWDILYLT